MIRHAACWSALFVGVGVVVVFDERDAADDVVGDGLRAGELQRDAHRGALPDGR